MSSITFAIFTNAKHHAFATYTIARNCKYRNNTLQSYWNNTFSAHEQKKKTKAYKWLYLLNHTQRQQILYNFQKKAKLCVPVIRYTFEITSWFHKYWHTRHHTIRLIHKLYKNSHQWHCEFVRSKRALQFLLNYTKKIILNT